MPEKHKTFGVSFHPDLQARANARAKEHGLTFSRYVTLCVDAELNGRIPNLLANTPSYGSAVAESPRPGIDLDEAIERGGQYGEMKTLSIDFEDDIEDILNRGEICFNRAEKVAHLRTDFLVQHVDPDTGNTRRIALECRYNIRNRYEVTLGQLIIIKNLPSIDAVILVVPYLTNFDPRIHDTFTQQAIPVTTPDNLVESINQTIEGLESS